MSILRLPRLFLSSPQAWDEFAHTSSVTRRFLFLVLPFSLIPPLMLEYAGGHIGAALVPGASDMDWSMAALSFLVAELLTVPLMAWAIQSIAASKGHSSTYREAFSLAAIAPIPLWLSSLALFSDQVMFIVAMMALGLAGAVVLIFQGVRSVLKVEEGLIAFDVAYTVTSLGLIAWALLIMLGLVPALA